ncbi:MAG TPA: glycosyltransferase family 39 protein, partial [Sphingomicrobium sp.]|nr:glycosyltransferase family 39 protein [Sphingomicrobium sp.]
MDMEERQSRLWWALVCAATLGGLALRIAAARGGLWTDEAWSVIYAARAGDAAGVFLRINHDNNHHLYSLWLQAIGPAASPMLARLPAIVAGTLCVPLAAITVARRSAWTGIVAAILFAVSPTMVNFGSEARGYSLMLLAALGFLWLAAEAVEGREKPRTPWWLGLV